jgi:hypothetical protein
MQCMGGFVMGSFVCESHHMYATPVPGKNFDAAPAPTLLYGKAKFLKRTKLKHYLVHLIVYDL